mmetsp:Transcript_11416/g.36279  ORF Transcript_11416/g.36279 Transcript_11416/m.36279 type:complete len:277 (-) Transcript_11416:578-1408(-)
MPWLSSSPPKALYEEVSLIYSAMWITLFFGGVVLPGTYHYFGDAEYLLLSVGLAAPVPFLPRLLGQFASTRLSARQSAAADHLALCSAVWLALFSFVGNYFWTHYFFSLLGSSYSFPVSYFLNDIPYFIFFITVPYFLTYHVAATCGLRRLGLVGRAEKVSFGPATVLAAAAFAYATAVIEVVTISSVPFYSHKDVAAMYTIGSAFYGLYFIISYPAYARMSPSWTLSYAAQDALSAAMVVFILCDFWRLAIGVIYDGSQAHPPGVLPFGSAPTTG